jgi:hypothetical protein
MFGFGAKRLKVAMQNGMKGVTRGRCKVQGGGGKKGRREGERQKDSRGL